MSLSQNVVSVHSNKRSGEALAHGAHALPERTEVQAGQDRRPLEGGVNDRRVRGADQPPGDPTTGRPRAGHERKGNAMNSRTDEYAEAEKRGAGATPQRREQQSAVDIHPAARLLPEPTAEEYERLKEDIRKNGLRVPIILAADGRILDGRSRIRACTELDIRYATKVATLDEMLDPPAFVLSMNAVRRHLLADQIVAIYLEANALKVEADQKAAQAAQQANLKKGDVRELHLKPSGKTSDKIARTTGVSRSTVERVQKVAKKAPERLADVAKGTVSAVKVLEGIQPSKQPSAANTYLTEIVTACKRAKTAIKVTVKERRAVDPVALGKAQEEVTELQDLLQTIAPRWECTGCHHALEMGEEPDPKWECSNEECGHAWVGDRQCDSCNNTFSRKELDHACPECQEEMEQVGWETVSDKSVA